MIFNPVMVKTGGTEIKELLVYCNGYDIYPEISIGGNTYHLRPLDQTFSYTEGQEVELPAAKSAKFTVGGGKVLLELSGGGLSVTV